ncbi:MAG: PP2C family protein-serine/threonine phosphatase, partial [Myxococcota bacterium]
STRSATASPRRDSHLRKELEIAGTVQRMLVPPTRVTVGGLTAHAWYRGAEQCSGDWWTLVPAGDGAMLVVGDVTGHGAPAAIVVGMIKGALDMALLGMGQTMRPYMMMNLLNHVLMDSVDREYFMTAVIARFDPHTGGLSVGNAGHRPPWILSPNGSKATKGNRQPPLGSTRGHRYVDDELKLEPGERLIAFTDGLVEARSPDGREFGERTLRAVCEGAHSGGSEAICAAVQRAVEAHVGADRPFTDDVTFVVFDA